MNPLQDLKDIHTPMAIESWPPAYGWWLLVAFFILGMYLLTMWLIKVRKVRFVKRQTLQALQQIDSSNLDCISQLNQLLKRVAMVYFPNQNVQKMHGKGWAEFLVNTLPDKKVKDCSESFESMQETLYQAHTSENTEFSNYQKSAEAWIKHALPPSKNILQSLEQKNA